MDDPLKAMQSQLDSLVGSQEVEQRRLLGDKRFDELIERERRSADSIIAFTASRATLRQAFVVAIMVACLLAVGWSVWAWVAR